VPGAENAKSASSERPLWLEASDKSEEFDIVRPDMAGRRFGERNVVVFRERAKLVMATEVMCRLRPLREGWRVQDTRVGQGPGRLGYCVPIEVNPVGSPK
jgi:hypothetical protein